MNSKDALWQTEAFSIENIENASSPLYESTLMA